MISVWAILLKIFLYLFMPKEGLKIPQHIAIIKMEIGVGLRV